jgi:hypothetical protein
MGITNFKPRDRFDFTDDTLDIGNPVTWSRSHFLKHLFKRIFAIEEKRFVEFYRHHLGYYLKTIKNSSEELFFKNLFETIDRQLKVLIGRDIYAANHVKTQ